MPLISNPSISPSSNLNRRMTYISSTVPIEYYFEVDKKRVNWRRHSSSNSLNIIIESNVWKSAMTFQASERNIMEVSPCYVKCLTERLSPSIYKYISLEILIHVIFEPMNCFFFQLKCVRFDLECSPSTS